MLNIIFPVNVIPVLRKGDEIPNYLRHITYIDARDAEDDTVTERLASAIANDLPETTSTFSINNKHSK